MLCPKCGALIADDSVYCSKCGITLKKPAVEALQPKPEQTAPVPAQSFAPAVMPSAPPTDPVVQYARAQAQPQEPQPSMPNTYLTQNILLTVFSVICCAFFALPTAVTGLVFSGIAQGALKQNDLEKGMHYAKLARIFMWISFGIEIATVVVYIVFSLLGILSLGSIFQNGLQGKFNIDQLQDFKDGIWK